jgi:hypothetical protein
LSIKKSKRLKNLLNELKTSPLKLRTRSINLFFRGIF